MHRVDLDTRERSQVQAVLLEPAPQLLVVDDRTRAVRLVPVSVPVRYTDADGTERRATASVKGRQLAGATVPIWVDQYGTIAGAPARRIDAVRSAAMGAVGVLSGPSSSAASRRESAVDIRQPEVEHDEVAGVLVEHLQRLGARAGREHREPGPLQVAAQQLADLPLVLHDEHGAGPHVSTSSLQRPRRGYAATANPQACKSKEEP
jgi:hypothetical protein